jgi:glutamate formiminotransferase/formiminotetrahydrofolate cyclodeaminase
MKLIECVPNFSEGRRQEVISAIREAAEDTPDVAVLDAETDLNHNRMVLTLVGTPKAVKQAALAASAKAIELIDLTKHAGEHPRMGAVDVVPFIPLNGATMEDCILLAREFAEEFARRFSVPVFLYEKAATREDRKDLAKVREGQFEGLRERIGADPSKDPDFGPKKIHPIAGATAVGARPILIAYNVDLDTRDLSIAKKIASKIRERDGGFSAVKALGFELKDRKLVQVSMNLTDYTKTAMHTVFDAISQYAKEYGVSVVDSEIVGLVPQDALNAASMHYLSLRNFTPNQIIENRLATLLRAMDSGKESFVEKSLNEFCESLSSKNPVPGGGSASAYAGALAASLVIMVAQLTIGKKNYEATWEPAKDILKQAEPLKEKLLELVDRDAEAYSLVASAMKMPKTNDQEQAKRDQRLESALKFATEVPSETLLISSQVFHLAEKILEIGNKNAQSDSETALQLARASILGAWSNVKVNLASLKDESFVNFEMKNLQPVVDEILEVE